MRIADLTTGARLLLGLGLPLLLWAGYGLLANQQLQQIGQAHERMSASDRAQAEAALQLHAATGAHSTLTMDVIKAPIAAAPGARIGERRQAADREIAQALATLERLGTSEQDRQLLADLKRRLVDHAQSSERVSKLVEENLRPEAALLFIGETLPVLNALQQSIQNLAAMQRQSVARGSIAAARMLLLIVGAVALLLSVAWAWWLLHPVNRGMDDALQAAQRLAAGELDPPIEVTTRGEAAQLQAALAQLQQGLRSTFEQMREDALRLSEHSRALADVRQQDMATTRTAPTEQAGTRLQALGDALRQGHEQGRQAEQLASAAAAVAARGGEVVGKVVDTMQAIRKSSDRIADIIGVIDGIAFQTNILALNAAVEAARAGEQGRGFAVVAAEVRILAGRSAAAAKEIKQLIQESVGSVAAGGQLVEQAGKTMQEVVEQVRQVAQTMARISQDTRAQDSDFSALQQAIEQLERLADDNATLLDRSSFAAQALEQQALQLAGFAGSPRPASVGASLHAP